MAEAAASYEPWEGDPVAWASVSTVVRDTWVRMGRSTRGQLALALVLGYGVLVASSLYRASQGDAESVHTLSAFVQFLSLVPWGGVVLAAVAGSPSLAEDETSGALELYFSRGVSRTRYVLAKSLGVYGAAFLGILAPTLLYWGSTWFIFESHPAGWGWAILGILGYAALGALVITLLAMGFSAALGSTRASVVTLLGVFAVLDVLVGDILMLVTESETLEVGSPISALAQQASWLFRTEPPFDFPVWWGGVTLAVTGAIGLALLARNLPRVRGEERGHRG